MLKYYKYIWGVIGLIFFSLVGYGVFQGHAYYQSLILANSNQEYNLAQVKNLLSSKELDIKNQQLILDSQEKYRRILASPGTIYFIDASIQSSGGIIQVDPYDVIRFVNTSIGDIDIHIYDTPDMTNSGLVNISLSPNEVDFFSLKQSGYYIYRTSLGYTGSIKIGDTELRDYTVLNFLDTKIFPLFDKDNADSLDVSMKRFREYISKDQDISQKCHDFGHKIGRKAFDIFGFATSISHAGEDICAGGYTHGILESYFMNNSTLADNPEIACDTVSSARKQSCFHGVGHGLMFHFYDDVIKSLEKCRTLSLDSYKNRCAEGVFMELYDGDPRHAGGQVKYSTGDIFAPCHGLMRPSEGYVCGFYAGLGYLRYNPSDYVGALSVCNGGGPYAYMCITGIGREVAKRYLGDALKLENICTTLGDSTKISKCITGGINYTALQFEDTPKRIQQYCLGLRDTYGKCEKYMDSIDASQLPDENDNPQ